jgi:chromosome segregation ATPase
VSTEQILLTIFAGVGAVWTVFKVILPRFVDAKIKADEYERARSAFREDKTFEMLEDTLEHWKTSHGEDRRDALATQKLQTDLIATISQLAANIDRQTDTIRILTQQINIFNDRLQDVEDKIGEK